MNTEGALQAEDAPVFLQCGYLNIAFAGHYHKDACHALDRKNPMGTFVQASRNLLTG